MNTVETIGLKGTGNRKISKNLPGMVSFSVAGDYHIYLNPFLIFDVTHKSKGNLE